MKRARRGFTLIEVMVVLLIVGLLAAGLSMPLAAQVQLRRIDETHRRLDEAREALLGFAASQGACPARQATLARRGTLRVRRRRGERPVRALPRRLLPAATLGLAPLDDEGFLRDAWGSRANRIRYAVPVPVGAVASPFTRANGLQALGTRGDRRRIALPLHLRLGLRRSAADRAVPRRTSSRGARAFVLAVARRRRPAAPGRRQRAQCRRQRPLRRARGGAGLRRPRVTGCRPRSWPAGSWPRAGLP
jgi:prepilin-type N-terminal cleavage/methylation domain-containing protein